MLKVRGISLQFSTDEGQIWWDNDKHHSGTGKSGFGFLISLRFGRLLRPIGKFWKGKKMVNPWFKGGSIFTLYVPFVVLPFVSVALGKYGFYIGGKIYNLDHDEYKSWVPKESWIGPKSQALALSASVRTTRIT